MDEKRFTLRMDSKLFNDISNYAKLHRRSVAKEIECAVAEYIHALKAKDHEVYMSKHQITIMDLDSELGNDGNERD